MRLPRFHRRPDPIVASAGFFSVLKTAQRTVTPRPSDGYRALTNPPSPPAASHETPEEFAARLRTVKIPLIGESGMMDRGQVRMALILAGAASFTYFVLWWIMRGHL